MLCGLTFKLQLAQPLRTCENFASIDWYYTCILPPFNFIEQRKNELFEFIMRLKTSVIKTFYIQNLF